MQSFNPRTRAGCDLRQPLHARTYQRFNPRTRAGCDDFEYKFSEEEFLFQSTHPCGVRPSRYTAGSMGNRCFNPRTRAGCDLDYRVFYDKKQCFNPRTRAGCDNNRKKK